MTPVDASGMANRQDPQHHWGCHEGAPVQLYFEATCGSCHEGAQSKAAGQVSAAKRARFD